MKTKQDAIREAYKALGMNASIEAEMNNGWDYVSVFQLNHVQEHFYDTKTDGKHSFGRPILLDGLEENHGWTRIETEADLPKSLTDTYFAGRISDTVFFNYSDLDYEDVKSMWVDGRVTHYQPIIKPEPPIY